MNFNYLSLGIATIIPMVMGFIYYHPKIMGNAWMKANGFTMEQCVENQPKPILYLICLVMSFFMAVFFWGWTTGGGATEGAQWADASGHSFVTFQHGAFHGLVFAITIFLPVFTTISIFEMRGFKWVFVNLGYWGLCAILMNGILSAWR